MGRRVSGSGTPSAVGDRRVARGGARAGVPADATADATTDATADAPTDAPAPIAAPADTPRDAPAVRVRRHACVDLPAFPLQLLLRREPAWAGHPVVVVERDEPQGRVLWANEEARRERVLPGQRYAAALSLAQGLRAGVVPEDEIGRGVDEVARRLRRFTPGVDPSRDEPGVFRLDAAGLSHLHPDLRAWADAIHGDLAAAGLRACVVVGWTEFGAYAVARALASRLAKPSERNPPTTAAATVVVFADEAAERRALRRVPLDRVLDRGDGASDARDLLAKLGVRTVDDFLALPAAALGERLGAAARRLHDLASGRARNPLRPAPCDEPARTSVLLEHPEADAARLLFIVKRLLDPLLFRTAERSELLAGIELRLRLDDDGAGAGAGDGAAAGTDGRGAPGPDPRDLTEVVRPAVPTLDAAQLLDLVRLRLESLQLRSGATEVTLTAQGAPATPEQLALFTEKPKRDLAAADRALARLRAEFGEDAVVHARLVDAHLPEASYAWERLLGTRLPRVRVPPNGEGSEGTLLTFNFPARGAGPADGSEGKLKVKSVPGPDDFPPGRAGPADGSAGKLKVNSVPGGLPQPPDAAPALPLVRRLFARPVPLPPRPRHEPDGWMLHGFEHGNVVRLEGPFVLAGGWWGGEEVRREYHFAETARGRLFWIFYDVRRRRWFLQGEIA